MREGGGGGQEMNQRGEKKKDQKVFILNANEERGSEKWPEEVESGQEESE